MNTRLTYWLTIIATVLVVLGIAAAVATSLQSYSNDLFVRGKSDFPAVSAAQSAERGAFEYALSPASPTVTVNGKNYAVSEAWVERSMEPQFPYVWLKRWQPLDSYQLVLRIEGLPYEAVCERVGIDDQPLLRPLPEDMAVLIAKFPSLDAVPPAPIRLQVYQPQTTSAQAASAQAAATGDTTSAPHGGNTGGSNAGSGEIILNAIR